jgi:hypothetical protein
MSSWWRASSGSDPGRPRGSPYCRCRCGRPQGAPLHWETEIARSQWISRAASSLRLASFSSHDVKQPARMSRRRATPSCHFVFEARRAFFRSASTCWSATRTAARGERPAQPALHASRSHTMMVSMPSGQSSAPPRQRRASRQPWLVHKAPAADLVMRQAAQRATEPLRRVDERAGLSPSAAAGAAVERIWPSRNAAPRAPEQRGTER